MKKLQQIALVNRNRFAVLAAGGTLAAAGVAGAQTTNSIDATAMVGGATNTVTQLISSGGPAIFGLVGLATGVVFLINRVRSVG